MENGEVVISLLLETLDTRTADAGRSGVYKKTTEPRSPVNWVLRSIELHYRSDPEGEGYR